MEGYVHGALRKKLLTAPFVEPFKNATLGKSYGHILKHCISVEFLLI